MREAKHKLLPNTNSSELFLGQFSVLIRDINGVEKHDEPIEQVIKQGKVCEASVLFSEVKLKLGLLFLYMPANPSFNFIK